jgi:hypothetical protein
MSYSRRDEAVMRRIAAFLRKQGINMWVDNEKLIPGTPIWEVEIEKAIKEARAVVVLLSPDSNTSPWVRREISYAEDNWVRIFPILIAGDERNAVPIRLTNHQRIDIRQNEDVGLTSLHTALLSSFEIQEIQEQWGQAEAAEIAARREEELEVAKKVAHHKAEQEKTAREKAEREAADKAAREKTVIEDANERETQLKGTKSFTTAYLNIIPLSWLERGLLGGLLGITIAITTYYFISIYLGPLAVSVPLMFAVCGISGLITYPHKTSLMFWVIGFVIVGIISIQFVSIGLIPTFIFYGCLIGFPAGAILSRILNWLNVLN